MKIWQRMLLMVLGNIACILALGIPIAIINKFADPQIRGFDPQDADIALPYKTNTISGVAAVLSAIAIFTVVTVPVEYVIAYNFVKRTIPTLGGKVTFAKLVTRASDVLLPIFGIFLSCLMLTGLVTDIIKYMVARPRPCFLDMCKPNYEALPQRNCTVCGSQRNPGPFWPLCPGCPYVNPTQAQFVCMKGGDFWEGGDIAMAKDKWLSFPSGHSSYTFFAMTYLAMYVHRRLGSVRIASQFVVGLRPLAVFLSMLFALWVACSRVADHRHRLTDVLAGAVLGSAIGVWSYLCITLKAMAQNGIGWIKPRESTTDENVESGPPVQLRQQWVRNLPTVNSNSTTVSSNLNSQL